MKVRQILPVAVMAIATLTGCESKKEMNSGIKLANMDTTAARGADFYQYACGGWMAAHPLGDEYSRFGTFDYLAENNREQLKGLIAEIASKGNEQGSTKSMPSAIRLASSKQWLTSPDLLTSSSMWVPTSWIVR